MDKRAVSCGAHFLATAGKDGYLYLLDRKTRTQVYESPTTTIRPAPHHPREVGDRFCPGVFGGTQWNGPAFDPARRTIYVGAVDWCMISVRFPAMNTPGEMRLAGGVSQWIDPDAVPTGWITSFDVATGSPKWKYQADAPVVAAVTPTAGGLVFSGDIGGHLLTLDADTDHAHEGLFRSLICQVRHDRLCS